MAPFSHAVEQDGWVFVTGQMPFTGTANDSPYPEGIEAQTLANVYQAIDAGHEIVPVLNKVDLPAAEPERVRQQIEDVIGLDASDAVEISAKTGLNIEGVLEALVRRLPPPKGDPASSA